MDMSETHTFREISQVQDAQLWSEIREIVNPHIATFKSLITENTIALFTGAGSSAYIGNVLEALDLNADHLECHAVPTTEIVLYPEKYLISDKNIILFSFARSGNSPESKAVIELAHKLNPEIKHVSITNNKGGFLAQQTNDTIKIVLPERTNDQSLAMTSSYTSMLVAAAHLLGEQVSESFIQQLPRYFDEILSFSKSVSALDFNKIFYVGSGVHGATAYETSLKMNELTMGQVNVYHETTLAFRHGPKAALTPNTLFIQMLSNTPYVTQYEQDISIEIDGSDKYHKVVLAHETADEEIYKQFQMLKLSGSLSEFERTLLYLWFGQLLAFFTSLKHDKNPDNPSSDGFINRVVKGVTIYAYE